MRKHLLVTATLLAASCGRSNPSTRPAAAAPATLLDRTLDLTAQNGAITLPVQANDDLVVSVESTGFDPMLEVTPPGADALHNDDYQGSRTRSQLTVHTTQAGTMRLAVSSFGGSATGRYHVTVRKVGPDASVPSFLALGTTLTGEVTTGDRTLPDGRAYEETMVLGPPVGGAYELRLTARGATVPLAIVLDPQGRSIAASGAGVYTLTMPFLHRVQLIAPAPGQSAGYAMTLTVASPNAASTPPTTALARDHHALPAQLAGRLIDGSSNVEGSLGPGSIRLPTGESADVYELAIVANQTYAIDAQSTDFDTYLLAIGPDGHIEENDDSSGTNAHLDVRFASSGRAKVVVTSYRQGMAGRYVLKISDQASAAAMPAQGAANTAVASGDSIAGDLARGDRTLQSGEFVDNYRRRFARGERVQLRLQSNDFDPYLIVRSPSGHQSDNDDFAPPDRSAGIDIPAAEDGDYSIAVTSYQAGEHGHYLLGIGENGGSNTASTATPSTNGSAGSAVPAANLGTPGEGRLFGIFVGISNYPPGVGNLDECANDAVKLAEALRNRGLLSTDRQVVLTDAQATRANVRAAFERVAGQMGASDTFMLFYSGHGSQIEGSHDPREIDGTDEAIYLYDGALIDDDMGRLFDSLNARLAVLSLDSCFAGGFAKDVITRPGRVGYFSSEEDVESSVASQFQAGGYLSYFMRTGVSGEADTDPRDGVLTVGELEHFLVVQFGRHATDVEMAGAYQHLVVDRGAVRSTEELWRYH